MKTLDFNFMGKPYSVTESGHIKANGLGDYSPSWIFLGGSSHHWHNRVTVTLAEAFELPGLLNGCFGWDIDHGTTRRWGGRYYGKTPRITAAHIQEQGAHHE